MELWSWLNIRDKHIVPCDVLWGFISMSGMSPEEIAEDFFNQRVLEKHRQDVKEMILWISQHPHFISKHWRETTTSFLLEFLLSVVHNDDAEFFEFFRSLGLDCYDSRAMVIACEYNKINIARVLLKDSRQRRPNKEDIRSACWNGCTEIVELLLQDGRAVPSSDAFDCARRKKHMKILKLLIQDSRVLRSMDISYEIEFDVKHTGDIAVLLLECTETEYKPTSSLLKLAIKNGNAQVVEWLFKNSHVEVPDNALRKALKARCANRIVDILIRDNRIDPSVDDNAVFKWAARHGETAIIEFLLKDDRVDPNAENAYALRWSSFYKRTNVVKMLLENPKVIIETEELVDTLKKRCRPMCAEIDKRKK
jgi:ankyrin repeat protein